MNQENRMDRRTFLRGLTLLGGSLLLGGCKPASEVAQQDQGPCYTIEDSSGVYFIRSTEGSLGDSQHCLAEGLGEVKRRIELVDGCSIDQIVNILGYEGWTTGLTVVAKCQETKR